MINRRELTKLALLATGSAVLGGCAMTRGSTSTVTIDTAEGTLLGLLAGDLVTFKGIHYGESTAGRRFQPPIPVKPWRGIRPATSLGDQSPQVNPDTSAWLDSSPQSEDCLVLNVWARPGAKKLPVMLWIHGGGYWWGSAGAPMYDGARFAQREDVVFVSVNHRLNALGFLHLAGMGGEFADSSNVGLLDLVEALRWVRRNIAAFGGDPDNVTIFGESGGAMKVSALMAMPAAKGLFSKAIMQSGATMRFLTPDEADGTTRQLLGALGLSPGDAPKLSQIPARDLANAAGKILEAAGLWSVSQLPFGPVIDPGSLPYQPSAVEAMKLSADVPTIMGTNADETAWLLALSGAIPSPTDDRDLIARIRGSYPHITEAELSQRIAKRRSADKGISRQQLLVKVTTDLWMGDLAVEKADARARAGVAPSYLYIFDWKDPAFGGRWAPHAAEVPFMLDQLDQRHIMSDSEDMSAARAGIDPAGTRFALRDAMMTAWANFARHGRPTAPSLPVWPPYDPTARSAMIFGASPTGSISAVNPPTA